MDNKRLTMMKRIFLMMSILLAMSASAFEATVENKTVDMPKSVADFYDIQPLSDEYLDQNLYVWGVGLNYPHQNYYEIGRKVVQLNYQLGQQIAVKSLEMQESQFNISHVQDYLKDEEVLLRFQYLLSEDIGRKRINECNRYANQTCIQATIMDADNIAQLNRVNQMLRERYESLPIMINHSVGYFHPYSFAHAAYPDMATVMSLLDLDGANAVLDFHQGHSEQGIKRLERISFFANILHNGTLTLPILQVNVQQALNQTVNALLDAGLLAPDDPVLTELYNRDVNRFDHKVRDALAWQAKAIIQNDLHLYHDYREKLIKLVGSESIGLKDEKEVAQLLYQYYVDYIVLLDQMLITLEDVQQSPPEIEGVPFNIYLASPYEYFMQTKYQKSYEKLLRTKIKILKGDGVTLDDDMQWDEEKSTLYIDLDESVENGSPLLPQPIRWFSQGQNTLNRLEVAIPKVK